MSLLQVSLFILRRWVRRFQLCVKLRPGQVCYRIRPSAERRDLLFRGAGVKSDKGGFQGQVWNAIRKVQVQVWNKMRQINIRSSRAVRSCLKIFEVCLLYHLSFRCGFSKVYSNCSGLMTRFPDGSFLNFPGYFSIAFLVISSISSFFPFPSVLIWILRCFAKMVSSINEKREMRVFFSNLRLGNSIR